MSSNEPKKPKPITTSAESHFEPPERIPDTLEVPPNTILLIPDHNSFVNPTHFEKAVRERDWFTSFFYFCLPLTFGSQHGFIMKATYDFVIRWNGSADTDSIDIHLLEDEPNPNFVTVASHFGHGILTVQSRYAFRTPKGVNLMVKEPPNYYVDGLSWLNAVVETDNLRRDFTFNIKVTRPNCDIYIKKGTPLGCILPYPRYFLDNYVIQELKDPAEVEKAQRTISYFAKEREEYDFSKPRLRYMEGKDIYDYKFEQHQKTLDNGEWWRQVSGIESTANETASEPKKNDEKSSEERECPAKSKAMSESKRCPVTGDTATQDQQATPENRDSIDASKCPVSGIKAQHEDLAELNKDLEDNIISIFLKPEYDRSLAPIRADKTRPWMEEDIKTRNHAKFCLPLMTASGVGHFLLSPATFRVEWDGDEAHDAIVTILDAASHTELTTHSTCGSITIQSKITVRTKQAGDYVYIKGVANQIRQPYEVLEAMIEAWWAPATFGIVMVLNQPCTFTIEKGQAIAQMFVVSREKADFDAKIVEGEPPRLAEWMAAEELRENTGKHFLYFKGTWPNGEPATPHYAAWGVGDTSESRKAVAAMLAENAKTDDKRPNPYAASNKSRAEKNTPMSMQMPKAVQQKEAQTQLLPLLISAFRMQYFLQKNDSKQAEQELSVLRELLKRQSAYSTGLAEAIFCVNRLLQESDASSSAELKELIAPLEKGKQAEDEWQTSAWKAAADETINKFKLDETKELHAIMQKAGNLDLEIAGKLIDSAHKIESRNNHHDAEALATLGVHILLTLDHADQRLPHALDFLGYTIGRQGKPQEGLQWYFIISSHPRFENDVYLQASSLNNLGFCFKPRKENQKEAEMCFLHSWELIKADPSKIMIQPRFLEDLAFFYRDCDQWQVSEKMFQALLDLRDSIDCSKTDKARSHTDLAFVLDRLNKEAKAEEHFCKALSIIESDPAVDRRLLAQQIDYLAYFYKQHKKLAQAVPLFERALAIRKEIR